MADLVMNTWNDLFKRLYAGGVEVPPPVAAATAEELAESMGPAPGEDERMKDFFFGRWRNGEPVR